MVLPSHALTYDNHIYSCVRRGVECMGARGMNNWTALKLHVPVIRITISKLRRY